MRFIDFITEDFRQTMKDKFQINNSEFANKIFIINPPMKLVDTDGQVEEIKSPTRFKIISMGKNFIRIKNLGYGNFPGEEKSNSAGKIYIVQGKYIDWFLRYPPGATGGDTGGMGGFGSGGGGSSSSPMLNNLGVGGKI